MIIIIALKLKLGVELEPGPSCGRRPLTRVNVRIKLIIIKVLKTRVEGRRGAKLGSRVGLTMTRVNIRIRIIIIIIIVLKLYLGVDPGLGSGHGLS
jgi:hypothetical protein